jgi:DNA-binding transcriptional LysR family regulator
MNERVSLRRLDFFAAVAEELHFGRAANRLHIAQPALSQQIRKLESELGLTLFERSTRSVRLTDDGRMLYPEVKRLQGAADTVGRIAGQLREGQLGYLRLGFVDSAAYELVPRFLHVYRTRWPDVELDLRHMSSDDQIEALTAGNLDLGIARAAGDSTLIRSRVFAREPLYVAVHQGHRFRGADTVRLRELAGERLIGFDRNRSRSLHAELTHLLDTHGATYSPRIEATEYTTILGIVAAGEGIAIVPASVRTFHPPGIGYVRIIDRSASVRLVLLTAADSPSGFVGDTFDTIAVDLGEIMGAIHDVDLI